MLTTSSSVLRNNIRYTISIDSRGAVGVSKWKECRPTFPVLLSFSQTKLILDDGVELPVPDEYWMPEAVYSWNKVKKTTATA